MPEPTGWPTPRSRSYEWTKRGAAGRPSRQAEAHSGRYQAAVLAPIADRTPTLPMSTLTRLAEATAAVARFDGQHGQAGTSVSTPLLVAESTASSKLARISASAEDIAAAQLGGNERSNARLIAANTRATESALTIAHKLDEHALITMHSELVADGRPGAAGRWRDVQVWVGGGAWGPHTATFVPPHADDVPAAMADLIAFMRRDDLPPLMLAAVAHAQLETVLPFPDGNGRAGRALVHALLRATGVTEQLIAPLSAGLQRDQRGYYAALTAYRRGDPAPIIELFIDATVVAVATGTALIDDLRAARSAWSGAITARSGATAWQLADLLIAQPVIDSGLVQTRLGVSTPTANAAIEHLVEVGVLTQVAGDRRDRRWAAPQILRALDDFAERARRS